MRILIVEDEFSLADLIANKLQKEKYVVDICTNGDDGLYNALTNVYDLIILDIMLPGINGIDILKQIKQENIKAKVIMLTAKSTLEDKLVGFDNGAIDYITKPFHLEELVARVNAQIRKDEPVKDTLEYDDLQLNIKNMNLTCTTTKEEINVAYREFLILEYFMQNVEQVVSKEQIYDKVWGIDSDFESNNLEAYLSFIRKKLKMIGSNVNIKSVRNLGYKMEKANE